MGKKGSRASKGDKKQPQWSEKLIQKAIKWQLLSPSTIKYHMENLTVFDWESDSLFITRKVEEVPEYAGLIYVDVTYNFDGEICGYPITFVKTAPIIHKDKVNLNTLNLIDKFYFNYITWKGVARNKDKQIEDLEKVMDNILNSESDATYNYNLNESKKIIEEQNQRIDVLKKQINDEEYNSKYYFERSRILQKLLIKNDIDYKKEIEEFDEKFDKEYGKEIDKK